MKTNNTKKIIVSTLSIAMGAALVGSISGSVAWYQYSTRASASMVGTAVGTSRNLLVSTTGTSDWSNYLTVNGQLKPVKVTKASDGSGAIKDLALADLGFKDKPVYQYASSGKAITSGLTSYVIQQDFYFKVMDAVDGADPTEIAGKNIWLQDLEVKSLSGLDLSGAIKVHVENEAGTVAATLGNTDKTVLAGRLDIGGASNKLDTDGIKLDDTDGAPVFYGATSTVVDDAASDPDTTKLENNDIFAVKSTYVYDKPNKVWNKTYEDTSATEVADKAALLAISDDTLSNGDKRNVASEEKHYKITDVVEQEVYGIAADKTAHTIICNDSDPYAITGGKVLATTTDTESHANANDMAKITLTIWLEGWGLAGDNGASWNYDDYAGSKVEINARFVTQAE